MFEKFNKNILNLQAFNERTLERLAKPKFIFFLAIVLWSVFSLPSIIFSQWFPLDMGLIFKVVQNPQEFDKYLTPYNNLGRYVPFYWLYHKYEFYLFGTNVAPYFLVQSLMFFSAAILSSVTLYKITGSLRAATFLFIAVYFSSPIAENLNTLGKPEPVVFLFIASIVLIYSYLYISFKGIDNLKLVLTKYIVISLFFAFSIWTKETSIVLFGFGLTGVCLSFILGKVGKVVGYPILIKDYLYFLLALVVGLCISKTPWIFFPALQKASTYTDYAITFSLVKSNLLFYINQQPDVIVFGVLSFVLLAVAGKQLLFTSEMSTEHQTRSYILAVSFFSMGWAYYLALLVWRWPMAYYMLLPVIVFKLTTLYALFIVNVYKLLVRPLRVAVYGVIAVCFVYAGLYIYYIASSQIAYTIVYREALQKYFEMPGEKKPLIMESYPFYSELVEGTSALILADTGLNLHVKGIADVLDPNVTNNPDILKLLGVSQTQLNDNINNLPRRGDYLLVITGRKLATWFCRGVTPYYSEDSLLKTQGIYDMELVADRQIKAPAVYQHIWSHNLVAEETTIGYKLYRMIDDEPKFLWRGRFFDGWIERKASLLINPSYHQPAIIKLSAPDFTLPNKVLIKRNGEFFKELEFNDTDEKTLVLSEIPKESAIYQFEVANPIIPQNIKLNSDTRELGLRIALDTAYITK